MDKTYQHELSDIHNREIKRLSTQPKSDYTTPYHHCTNNPNSYRGPSTPAQSHSVIRATPPEREGMMLRVRLSLGSCSVAMWPIASAIMCIPLVYVSAIVNAGVKQMTSLAAACSRWSSQQQQNTWSRHLPGGFLMEEALRQKVIIVAAERSGITHCEDKHIIKSRRSSRGRYSYYHPLEIYALQGWVLWVSGLDKSDEAEWV